MSTRLSWTPAQKYLVSQAERALYTLYYVNYQCDFSVKIALELFDKLILPIITYGSEIWSKTIHDCIESLQLKYLKRLLGVGRNTPSQAVRGDCGRHNVFVYCTIKYVKYWFKMLAQNESSLLHSCYKMLYEYCENGRNNWATGIKQVLTTCGFGFVWDNQGVPNVKEFMKSLETRLKDCDIQEWTASKFNISKLRYYNMYKTVFEIEPYLLSKMSRKHKKVLAKFRMANHVLEIEKGRHNNVPIEDRLCQICGIMSNRIAIECEYHVLFECNAYHDLREMFSNNCPLFESSLYNFVYVMKCQREEHMLSLANYLFKLFQLRSSLIESFA